MPHRTTRATRPERIPRLNDNQERWLFVTFEYIDRLLKDIEEVLDGPPDGTAFPRTIPDIPGERRQMIREAIPPIRHRLVQVLDDLAVRRTQKAIPASRAIRTNLTTIEITLEELKRKEWGKPDRSAGDGEEMKNMIDGLCDMVSVLEGRVDEAMNEHSSTGLKG